MQTLNLASLLGFLKRNLFFVIIPVVLSAVLFLIFLLLNMHNQPEPFQYTLF